MTSRSSGSNKGSGSRNKQNKPHAKTSSSHSSINGSKGKNHAQRSVRGNREQQHVKRPLPADGETDNNYSRPTKDAASSLGEHNLHHHAGSVEGSSSNATSRPVRVPVLYEDNHVIGVVKPVNIPSQADDTGDEDMLTLIKQDLKERHQKAGNVFLGLVHRLDRPVGGAMLFAKTSKGASRLSDSVRNGQLLKRYVAVLRGIPTRPKATLRDTLLKHTRTNTSAVVSPGTPGGKDAILDYEVLATHTQSNLSLVLITLHTGRSHQIRVQMAHAGYPLYGDQRYGMNVNRPGEQLALWSVLAGAPHPVKDEMIRILSLPPRVRPWNSWQESLYSQLAERLEREQD